MKFRHFRLGNVRGAVNTRIQPWHRYHGFLTIIRERYEAEAKRYHPHPKPGVRIYRVTEDVRERLQLEVETFYLFANMLLDQIAVNVRFFFGFTRGRKTKLHPNGEDWGHLTLLDKLARDASAMGLSGMSIPSLLRQTRSGDFGRTVTRPSHIGTRVIPTFQPHGTERT